LPEKYGPAVLRAARTGKACGGFLAMAAH